MKLSSLTALAATAAIMASCSGSKKAAPETTGLVDPFDYTLTVTNINADDDAVVYLYDYDAITSWRNLDPASCIDSATVVDATATFTVNGSNAPVVVVEPGTNRSIIFLEPGDNTFDVATSTGSAAIQGNYKTYVDSMTAIYISANDNMPAADSPEREAFTDSVYALLHDLDHTTLDANLDNPFGYFLTTVFLANGMEAEQLDSCLAVNPRMADTKRIKDAQANFKKLEATSAGHPYTDFEIEYNGATTKLSDYVKPGQYTLVDFWASWCGPCKRAIADLKANYETLNAEGLNIVGVAVWEDPADTEAWLQDNPLPWPVILNAQAIPTDLYAIKGIPTLVLVGPDGNILARSYDEEEILSTFHAALAPAE